MKRAALIFILIQFISVHLFSQDILWTSTSKDLSFLKGEEFVKIEFKYNIDKVNGTQTEAEFVEQEKTTRNLKIEGRGDKFVKDWTANRSFLFNPSFTINLNKHLKGKFEAKEKCEACKYKMVVTIKELKTGKDNKVSTTFGQVPAGGNFWVEIIEISSNTVLISFQLNDMKVGITPRNDDNFFPWINEAFSKAGRLVAQELIKK